MAIDAHVIFEGPNVEGESNDAEYKGKIQALNVDWGGSNPGSFGTGSGGGVGKFNVNDVSFGCVTQKSTPELIKHSAKGTHFDKVTIVFRKQAGDKQLPFMWINMKKVLISSVNTNGEYDNVTLNGAQVWAQYQAQDDKGKKQGGPVGGGWDQQKQKALGVDGAEE